VKMPFERLMEEVAALGDEDKALPMGRLAERWGEPVQRIADAIDAVRVMNGERTYITVRPAPDKPACPKCGTSGCLDDAESLPW